jgi:predicted nucleotidyltransferase
MTTGQNHDSYQQYLRLRGQVQRASRDVRDVALLFGSTPSRSQNRTDFFLWIRSFVAKHLSPLVALSPSLSASLDLPTTSSEILVVPFGSHVTGLAHADSDLDVTIVFQSHMDAYSTIPGRGGSLDHVYQREYVTVAEMLVSILVGPLPVQVEVLGSSHCPRIRLRHVTYGVEADITFGNVVAAAASSEIQQYVLAHPSIVPFYQFLHALMRERQIQRNQMSSYLLTVIAVSFFRFHTKSIGSVNSLPGQALMYFLHTFGTCGSFDPARMCLSPSHPDGILPRSGGGPGAGWVVHCPIRGSSVNIASSCYLIFQVRDVFHQVYEMLDNNYFSGSLRNDRHHFESPPPSLKSRMPPFVAAGQAEHHHRLQQRDGVNVYEAICCASSSSFTAGSVSVASTENRHLLSRTTAATTAPGMPIVTVGRPHVPAAVLHNDVLTQSSALKGFPSPAADESAAVCSHILPLVFPRLLSMTQKRSS